MDPHSRLSSSKSCEDYVLKDTLSMNRSLQFEILTVLAIKIPLEAEHPVSVRAHILIDNLSIQSTRNLTQGPDPHGPCL